MRPPVNETLQDDRTLVERAAGRDMDAFEQLVERYRSKVYGLALRMMKDRGEAEEIMQETFLSAWQNLPNFRGDSAFGSWLYRICANYALMRLRRRKFEAPPGEEPALPGPRFDSEGTILTLPSYDWSRGTEEKALDRELGRAIEQATEALPDDYRTVFLLKDVEGLSYEEIAEVTRASVPAIKSRLHRARLALREAIEAFYKMPRARVQAAGDGTAL
ncbi:MAG TPA: RNA polymerase subunit sigma-70 [Myxococcales bacterium]|nr:RNA polymerase subunit sigma-70 [Myxococcales bacterium]